MPWYVFALFRPKHVSCLLQGQRKWRAPLPSDTVNKPPVIPPLASTSCLQSQLWAQLWLLAWLGMDRNGPPEFSALSPSVSHSPAQLRCSWCCRVHTWNAASVRQGNPHSIILFHDWMAIILIGRAKPCWIYHPNIYIYPDEMVYCISSHVYPHFWWLLFLALHPDPKLNPRGIFPKSFRTCSHWPVVPIASCWIQDSPRPGPAALSIPLKLTRSWNSCCHCFSKKVIDWKYLGVPN